MPNLDRQIAWMNRKAAQLRAARSVTAKIENMVPCFTPGTLIATPFGETPVEELQVGDQVVTRDNGLQEIRWIASRRLGGGDLAQAPDMKPVLIKAGALGAGLPDRDIILSPWHRILVKNDKTVLFFDAPEVLATAGHLTGMAGVSVIDVTAVAYIHFMCDQHQLVMSNGYWSESFRPDDAALDGLGAQHTRAIYDLFPELRDAGGRAAYEPARRALNKTESSLLVR